MAKAQTPYVDEMASRVKSQPPQKSRQDAAAAAYLAVRDDVEAAIAAGFPVATIWRHLRETGRMPYRYDTFLKYTRRFARTASGDEPAPATAAPTSPAPAASAPVPVSPNEPRRTDTSVPGFSFTAAPNKEDLF